MKRFLTVLLVIAVMFTFSFGTSFAAEYSLDDYNKALAAEKTNQITYMQNAKTQAINGLTFDKDGYATITPGKYAKAAIEAAADKVIADKTAAMDAAINTALNGSFPIATAPDKTVVSTEVGAANTAAGMLAALEAETATLDKTQAPISKAAAEAAIAKVDAAAYPADNAETSGLNIDGTPVSNAEYVQSKIDAAKKAVADAEKSTTLSDADKITAYATAASDLESAIASVKTNEDIAIEGGEAVKTVEQAINEYVANTAFTVFNVADKSLYPYDATSKAAAADGFYTAKTAAKKATMFGVEIADITAVTRAEAVAVNDAAYAAANAIKPTMKAYANGDVAKITALATDWDVVYRFTTAADVYEKVKAEGEKMKAETQLGIKVYDDAAIDKEVAAAEAKVMADIATSFGTPASYIDKTKCGNKNFDIKKFEQAQADAKAKFIDKIVTVGANPTAEADKVYAKELYADATKYADVKAKAEAAIDAAQSYEDIDKALEDAKAELGKLMLAKDAADVAAAQTAYYNSLVAYKDQVKALGKEGVSDATYNAAVAQGKDLIDAATTVDAVKAAYEEAKKIVDDVKTDKEIEAAAKAVNDAAQALPYDSTITAADEAAVKAAYDAIKEYKATPGADMTKVAAAVALVDSKLDKVYEAKAKAIEEEAKAVKEAYDALPNGDAGVEAAAALAEKANAVKDAADALDKEIADTNDELIVSLATDITDATAYPNVDAIESYIADDCNDAVVDDAENKMIMAAKPGATQEEIQAAADAYNKLTEKQKAQLKGTGITNEIVESVMAKAETGYDDEAVKAALQDMSIVARSTKLSSGKIKVTVKADVQTIVDNGYTVKYKFFASTKSSKKGYASKIEKSTKSFTTSGVKGKTNYWKVTVKVFDAEGNLVAKTPLTQCRYACRTL